MKNTLKNIRGLINRGFREFHLYSCSDESIHHEFFSYDKIFKDWSYDIYGIEYSEITKFDLYNEDNLNEYLVASSERIVEYNLSEEDILSRICSDSSINKVILETSSKNILKDFMSVESKEESVLLYAVNSDQIYDLETECFCC